MWMTQYYYKISSRVLKEYVEAVGKKAFRNVLGSLDYLTNDAKCWVRDDVDYPEAVEVAELVAFERHDDDKIDEDHADGYRWVSSDALRRLKGMCWDRNPDVGNVIVSLINHCPYPEDVHPAMIQVDETAIELTRE